MRKRPVAAVNAPPVEGTVETSVHVPPAVGAVISVVNVMVVSKLLQILRGALGVPANTFWNILTFTCLVKVVSVQPKESLTENKRYVVLRVGQMRAR